MSHTTRDDLETRAAELRKLRDAPSPQERAAAELQRVEAEIADRREAAGRSDAEQRLSVIARERREGVEQIDEDERRVVAAAEAYRQAVATLNDRYRQLVGLTAEATALADRFGIAAPSLVSVAAPAMRGPCRAAEQALAEVALAEPRNVSPAVEEDADRMRSRRSYSEVRGTPGHAIIERAGLKPFAPLTARQREMLADRNAQKERDEAAAAKFAAAAAAEAARLTHGTGLRA